MDYKQKRHQLSSSGTEIIQHRKLSYQKKKKIQHMKLYKRPESQSLRLGPSYFC